MAVDPYATSPVLSGVLGLQSGARIAEEYTLDRRLGNGGYGEVWLASQERLKRQVALKFATPAMLQGAPDGLARFAQEVFTQARLTHRHIVPLLDAQTHLGMPFLVMPFLRGGTLGDRAGQLDVASLARHGAAVCDALNYAHLKGVVHRDIKPANLLIDDDGEVLVADFGIAKLMDTLLGHAASRGAGTRGFGAPEQLREGQIDARCDIFGLGATLYNLATAQSPYDLTTLRRETALGALDPRLRPVIARMTAYEPQDRFASAAEAKAALLAVLEPRAPAPASRILSFPSYFRSERMRSAALLGVISSVLGYGWWVAREEGLAVGAENTTRLSRGDGADLRQSELGLESGLAQSAERLGNDPTPDVGDPVEKPASIASSDVGRQIPPGVSALPVSKGVPRVPEKSVIRVAFDWHYSEGFQSGFRDYSVHLANLLPGKSNERLELSKNGDNEAKHLSAECTDNRCKITVDCAPEFFPAVYSVKHVLSFSKSEALDGGIGVGASGDTACYFPGISATHRITLDGEAVKLPLGL